MNGPHAAPPSDRPGSRSAAIAAFAGTCLIWGSTFLVIRIGNDQLPPLWAATIRLALALLLLLLLLRMLRVPFPRGDAFRAAAWFGFLNFGVSFSLLYWGETRVSSGLTAIVYATIPLTSSLFARAFGLERLSPRKIAGALVALAGVGLIFWEQVHGAIDPLHLFGILVAATCGSLSSVLLKRGPRQHPFAANAGGAVVGLPVCLAASLLLGEPHPLPRTLAAIAPILYLTLLGSIGAYGLFAWLVSRWPVSRVSFIAVVVPVIALVLGAIVRHERLTLLQGVGSALVLAGLAVAILPEVAAATESLAAKTAGGTRSSTA